MKSIYGHWALDAAPTPTATDAMRAALDPRMQHREAWQGEAIAFAGGWWSPQSGLDAPALIARHPDSGCVAIADARLDEPEALRHALGLARDPAQPADDAANLILHAWLRWGEDCVDHLDGDFAFAIRDPRRNCLFLARDRMAGRPLYLHHVPGRLLVFGSSSRLVLAHPKVPDTLDEARIADVFVSGLEGVDFTSTFHLAVQRHPPRHALLVTPERHALRRYWTLQPGKAGPLPNGDDAWADALTAVLERAVARRIGGPERAGSMLSGGLDSTSLAIIAGEQLQAAGRGPLPTFSAIHSGLPGCKETEAVGHLRTMPIFDPQLADIADLGALETELRRFLAEFEEPFDAGYTLLDAQYANAARIGVDGVIDGIDGDNLFSDGDALRRQVRGLRWGEALANARGLGRIYGGPTWFHLLLAARSSVLPDWLRQALRPLRARRQYRRLLQETLLHPDFARRIHLDERLQKLRDLRSPSPSSRPEAESAEALMHTFPTVGLERYYRIAARHGITPLHPFTDREVLELCVNLPDRQRLRDGWSKPVLRRAMRGRMPEPVRLRADKQHLGWQLTTALWAIDAEASLARVQAARPQLGHYLHLQRVDALLAKQRAKPDTPQWPMPDLDAVACFLARGAVATPDSSQ